MHPSITTYISLSFTLPYIITVLQSLFCLTTEAEQDPALDSSVLRAVFYKTKYKLAAAAATTTTTTTKPTQHHNPALNDLTLVVSRLDVFHLQDL